MALQGRSGDHEEDAMRRMMNGFAVGVGVGYVLGARAGREQYDRIVEFWNRATGNPVAERLGKGGRELMGHAAEWVGDKANKVPVGRTIVGAIRPETDLNARIADVMTAGVETVRSVQPLTEVARTMREQDVGAVVVVDAAERVRGIVTDRDLAIRGVAEGNGPDTAVEAILSEDVITLSPEDSIGDAVRTMREHAVRRLPVVVDERAVGIVSLGDLAIERDSGSALAEISSAAPNR
jgi:CBS domain-containing protein